MAETAEDRDAWRRRHSLLALWQDATAFELRDTSLLSITVDDCPEEADRAALQRMARSCRDGDSIGHDDAVELADEPHCVSGAEPVATAAEPDPEGEAAVPQLDDGSAAPVSGFLDPGSDGFGVSGRSDDPAFSPWQPARGSATHPEPSALKSQMDEIGDSLREVRKELTQLRERRARRYF